MTTHERRPPGRPRRAELSERQRDVLDLLVAGKTNPEIADALGITLDGAKYHVREICDRLGLDTREEAAEWWRQQRGLRARFAILPEWRRLPRPVRWAALGGAGLAAGALVVVALLFALMDHDEAGLEPGVWLAVVVPTSETADGFPLTQIHIVRLGSDETFVLAEPGHWGHLAWSPDGRFLIALDANTLVRTDSTLVIFDVAARHRRASTPLAVPFLSRSTFLWAPDGSRIALGNTGLEAWWTGTANPGGAIRGQPVAATNDGSSQPCTPMAWSPDSTTYACADELVLRFVDRDGVVLTETPISEIGPPQVAAGPGARVTHMAWGFDARFEVMIFQGFEPGVPYVVATGTISNDLRTIAWETAEPAPREEVFPLIAEMEALSEEVARRGLLSVVVTSTSRNSAFAGLIVAPPSERPLETGAIFLAIIDGKLVEHPLGRADGGIGFFAGGHAWDMVRVD